MVPPGAGTATPASLRAPVTTYSAAVELPWLIVVSALVVCAAASFFFALAESALFALGQWRARALAETDGARGAVVVRLLGHADDLLASIVLGNALANALLIALSLL